VHRPDVREHAEHRQRAQEQEDSDVPAARRSAPLRRHRFADCSIKTLRGAITTPDPRGLSSARLIVPCYNEEHRLDRARFVAFARDPRIELLFIDDGSKDGTASVLADLTREGGGKIAFHSLPRNAGKGEAVRQGLLRALEEGASVVGYAD